MENPTRLQHIGALIEAERDLALIHFVDGIRRLMGQMPAATEPAATESEKE